MKNGGNPNEKIYYDYIKSYSPYDNIKKMKYPSVLIRAGYHDPRVPYWEPAKWTAKLRDNKTDKNLLLLLTNMKSGHFGFYRHDRVPKRVFFILCFFCWYRAGFNQIGRLFSMAELLQKLLLHLWKNGGIGNRALSKRGFAPSPPLAERSHSVFQNITSR